MLIAIPVPSHSRSIRGKLYGLGRVSVAKKEDREMVMRSRGHEEAQLRARVISFRGYRLQPTRRDALLSSAARHRSPMEGVSRSCQLANGSHIAPNRALHCKWLR